MYLGILKIKINLPANHTLKGKRTILQSLFARIRSKTNNIALSEIDSHDLWQISGIGIVCISNDPKQAEKLLAKTLDFIREWQADYILLDHHLEIITV
jgi:uncharacterized protein YlxP (DUF503 family)